MCMIWLFLTSRFPNPWDTSAQVRRNRTPNARRNVAAVLQAWPQSWHRTYERMSSAGGLRANDDADVLSQLTNTIPFSMASSYGQSAIGTEYPSAAVSVTPTAAPSAITAATKKQDTQQYLFELAPLGPQDLLARCREGAGNWWGDMDEYCLRVDERGTVVLVDPEMYYEYFYTRRNYIRIVISVFASALWGRSLGQPSPLTPRLVEHLARVWHRPRRPVEGAVRRRRRDGSGHGGDNDDAGWSRPTEEGDVVAVGLGRRIATMALQPWITDASVMSPPLGSDPPRAFGSEKARKIFEERMDAENSNFYGQVLAWSEDASVIAVSLPAGGVACLSNRRESLGACLATVSPRNHRSKASVGTGTADSGVGIAGVALRGVSPMESGGMMEVMVLSFDAALTVHSFFAGGAGSGVGPEDASLNLPPLLVHRLGKWHESTCTMAFHAATDTIAVAGPSGVSRSESCLSLTLWRISGGGVAYTTASSETLSGEGAGTGAGAGAGAGTRLRSARQSGGHGAEKITGTMASINLSELHSVSLAGGSFVVPAPRAGLDRAPPGTVPALLPLVFPGLRAVAPPVQVVFGPSGKRVAVLDLVGGVTVVEASADAAHVSGLGRRALAADGRSWLRQDSPAARASPIGNGAKGTVTGTGGGGTRAGAGVPRAVSIGWWSEDTLAAMSSTGDLAFLDTRPSDISPAVLNLDLSAASTDGAEITTAFQGDGIGAPPRPPPLGPGCTVWCAGDGKRAAVCWPGAGGGEGRWGGDSFGGDLCGKAKGKGLARGVRSGGAGGSVMGLLSLGTAEEAVEGRVRRGLLEEALDLAGACGVDAGGVRAVLWRKAVEGGSFETGDVDQHLVGTSDHRWVVHEALNSIGLAATESAARALLKEGLRRCDSLIKSGINSSSSSGRPPASLTGPISNPSRSSLLPEDAATSHADGSRDGWDFDDGLLDDDDDSRGDEDNATETSALNEEMERPKAGASRARPAATAAVAGMNAARSGSDVGGTTAEVLTLSARMTALEYLFETNVMAEYSEGRMFDALRFREFLMLQGTGDDPSATAGRRTDQGTQTAASTREGLRETASEMGADGEASEWEREACRIVLLRKSLIGFAAKGEASAAGVLFERHPRETLPIRLTALSTLPETLDPASYAQLLPCCVPAAASAERTHITAPSEPLFFCMVGGERRGYGESETLARSVRAFGKPAEGDTRAGLSFGFNVRCTDLEADLEAAARTQGNPRILAAWYTGRARELDARAGQLRHASTLCLLGVHRITVGGVIEPGSGRSGPGGDRPWGVAEKMQALARGEGEEEMEFARLSGVMQHLSSLVYTGRVSPSMSLAEWECLGLEDRMAAVIKASSAQTIARDVRDFYSFSSSSSASPAAMAAPPADASGAAPDLEGTLVRVLGAMVESGPSAENMEACAAVAKASRPEVAVSDRLIRSPEALLTLFLDACYAWTHAAPDERALEAAWELLECMPSRREDVDALLQDRVDALEGHLYATQVLQIYGLAPPLSKYLEMGGGAEGSPGKDSERYNSFARSLVDQMCAVAMDRSGVTWGRAGGDGNIIAPGGGRSFGPRKMWQRGKQMVGGGGGQGPILNSASREGITRLHKDVSRLQRNAWQGLAERWAIKRVLQAVVEAGQLDVARALVLQSSPREQGGVTGGGQEEHAENKDRARGEVDDDKAQEKWQERREIAEDVLLSAAIGHFNAAASFDEGEELMSARRWLDLLPWSSPPLDRERRLHAAGKLAHDLGATDLVPLQLRLLLGGGSPAAAGHGRRSNGTTVASGALDVIREVLRCNPDAVRGGAGTSGGAKGTESSAASTESMLFGSGEGIIRTPPGTGLVRLAGLLGLTSSADQDVVRAMMARKALDAGDGEAACEMLSAAILRRPARRGTLRPGDGDEASPFSPELCEALDVVVGRGREAGDDAVGVAASRIADLCALALSRCPASQIGRLLSPWSRFEAARYVALGGNAVSSTMADETSGGSSGGSSGGDIGSNVGGPTGIDRVSSPAGETLPGVNDEGEIASQQTGSGPVGTASTTEETDTPSVEEQAGALARTLVAGGMGRASALSIGRALSRPFSSCLSADILLRFSHDVGGGPGNRDSEAVRAAQGALRMLLIHSTSASATPPTSSGEDSVGDEVALAETIGAIGSEVKQPLVGELELQKARDRLCVLLAVAELGSSSKPGSHATADRDDGSSIGRTWGDGVHDEPKEAATGFGRSETNRGSVTLADEVAEEYGIGAVERGVGYALAAMDGRSVLGVLRDLLEGAEAAVKALREADERDVEGVESSGPLGRSEAEPNPTTEAVDPDEGLVQSLFKRGISTNRARRACAATRNSSYGDALAWCVEHAGDPVMDAPYMPPRRTSRHGNGKTETKWGNDAAYGRYGTEDGGERRGEERRAAARAHRMAAAALETYVRARLSIIGDEHARGGEVDDDSSVEVKELTAVLTSFRQRKTSGRAEDRARALLPTGVDLVRFAQDRRYRQDELEQAAAASWVGGGKSARDIIALAREYADTDVWDVTAAATRALLGQGYASLRKRGLTAASACAFVNTELRSGGSSSTKGDGAGDRGSSGLVGVLLGVDGDERRAAGQDVLELARGVYLQSADGKDLHHLELLLRVMCEAAAKPDISGDVVGGSESTNAGGHGGIDRKIAVERRLKAHFGLVRRLQKVAPTGLDYKCLVGEDPLEDPLADPPADVKATGAEPALEKTSTSVRRSGVGLAAARVRAMAEVRSVAGVEHTSALSKLAARIPGLSGSAVYLAVAERVLCGETGGLSMEALELLREGSEDSRRGNDETDNDEAEAASSSVYHLLSPLLRKMALEDLVEITSAACAPTAAARSGAALGYYPCRRAATVSAQAVDTSAQRSMGIPFPDEMEPLRLTLRCRRRILTASTAVLEETLASTAGAEGGEPSIAKRLTRSGALLDALNAASSASRGSGEKGLEKAFATTDTKTVSTASRRAAVGSAAAAVTKMVIAGAHPTDALAVCSSMRAALGVDGPEAPVTDADEKLDLSRVYVRVTYDVLKRLVGQEPDSRTHALKQLRAICAAVADGATGKEQEGVILYGDQSEAGTAAASRAWEVIGPALDLFCREGVLERTQDGKGREDLDPAPAASSVVLWARAEVLTLLRSFGGSRPHSQSRLPGHVKTSDAVDLSSDDNSVCTGRDDDEVVPAKRVGPDSKRDSGEDTGSGSSNSGHGNDAVEAATRVSPSSELSVPFLRVAELAMEAFGARVAPEDVGSWEARSNLVAALVDDSLQGRHLQAIVHIIGVWETEACAGSVTVVQRVCRLRVERTVKSLVQGGRVEPSASTEEFGVVARGNGRASAGRNACRQSGADPDAAQAFLSLSREWWPKLISAAAQAREWTLLSRCFSFEGCAAFTTEEFETILWSRMEANHAPILLRLKVGLASLHASRNRAAADLMASESTRVEDGMLVMDEEVLQLALSSQSLPQLANTQMYPSLVSHALRREQRWPPLPSSPLARQPQPRDGDRVSTQETSTAEFLLLAMACTGAHTRAAALACEMAGIHPGLRSLDGGLIVLERRLRSGRTNEESFDAFSNTGGYEKGDLDRTAEHPGWGGEWLRAMRSGALQAFEADVLE